MPLLEGQSGHIFPLVLRNGQGRSTSMHTLTSSSCSTPGWAGIDQMSTVCALGLTALPRQHLNTVSHPTTNKAQRYLTLVYPTRTEARFLNILGTS